MAGRPGRRCAAEFLAPVAVAGGRAGMGGRRLPRVCPRFRRGSTRGGPTPTPVAPGLDHRTRGPLLFGPRPRPQRLPAADPGAQQYAAWGATAKVAQLDWAYP